MRTHSQATLHCIPIPGPNAPYLQRTTVPYPASPDEPLGTLTDHTNQPTTLKERPSELLRSCAPHRAQQPDYIAAWIISWIPSTLPNAAAFDRRCVWWMKKEV